MNYHNYNTLVLSHWLVRTIFIAVGVLGAWETASANVIVRGSDYFKTVEPTSFDFALEGLPQVGEVPFKGIPIVGEADTVVRRLGDAVVNPGETSSPIPIQIIGLSLTSRNGPVNIDGILYEVFVTLDPDHLNDNVGTLTISMNEDGTGGTYTTVFDVFFKGTFTPLTGGSPLVATHNDTMSGGSVWSTIIPLGALTIVAPNDGSEAAQNANFHTGLAADEHDFYPGVPPGSQIDISQALVVNEQGMRSLLHHGHHIVADITFEPPSIPEPSSIFGLVTVGVLGLIGLGQKGK